MTAGVADISRAELRQHDPTGGRGGRWLCPLPACAGHTDPRRHRSVSVREADGLWNCKRCGGRGKLRENQTPYAPRSYREREAEKAATRRAALIRALERHRPQPEIPTYPGYMPPVRPPAFMPPCPGRLLPPCPPVMGGSYGVSLCERVLAAEAASAELTEGFSAGETSPRSGLERLSAWDPPGYPSGVTGGQGGMNAGGIPPQAADFRSRLGTLRPIADVPEARAYVESRGFRAADALTLLHRAGVRYAADFGRREADRERPAWWGGPALVFPIRNEAGALVAGQGRFLSPTARPKALTFGPRSEGVFATPGVLTCLRQGTPVALCEAPLDALSLALNRQPALALCGCSGVPEWLLNQAFGRQFRIAFDADEAGHRATLEVTGALTARGGSVEALPPPAGVKDWNEALRLQTEPWTPEEEAALEAFLAR